MNESSECPIFSGPELVDGGKEIIWPPEQVALGCGSNFGPPMTDNG
jgi:hypothetical protein